MQEGAFALIDCLGFKGIWKRIDDPQLLLNKLHKIATAVKEQIRAQDKTYNFLGTGVSIDPKKIEFKTSFFSDTVFVGLQYKENIKKDANNTLEALLVRTLCRVVIKILDLFIQGEPHLTMRGCITYGQFIGEGDFYAGPAVDLAAEYMDIAEGAFVWLHKSAANYYERWEDIIKEFELDSSVASSLDWDTKISLLLGPDVQKYTMPIKEKGTILCYVLNPLSIYQQEADRQKIIRIYKKEMDDNRLDIWIKQQNTVRFLEAANELVILHRNTNPKGKRVKNHETP